MQQANANLNSLPNGFHILECRIGDWALKTEQERREKRATSSFEELRAYYDVVGPQMRAIAAHLDTFPMGVLPGPELALLNLAQMFMEVAIAVEFYGQPELPRGFPRQRWVIAQ